MMNEELRTLCEEIKNMIKEHKFDKAYMKVTAAMEKYPDSGIPHNLMGILYEERGDRAGGMKHFRAAWALEPAYIPARWNMEVYGGFDAAGRECAYMLDDCREEIKRPKHRVVYDERGIGHFEYL